MIRTKNKPAKRAAKTPAPKQPAQPKARPAAGHAGRLYRLRRPLLWGSLAFVLGGGAAIGMQASLTSFLLQPATTQQLTYTTPSGLLFLLQLGFYGGLLAVLPVIVWQLLRRVRPAQKGSWRFVAQGSSLSVLLVILGTLLGKQLGLSIALGWVLEGLGTSALSASGYFTFAILYLLSTVVLLHIPLALLLVNRVKRFAPGPLMRFQRWLVVGALAYGAIASPTAGLKTMILLSAPIIISYQVSILLLWAINRSYRKAQKVQALLQRDLAARNARRTQFQQAQEVWIASASTAAGIVARHTPTQRTWQEPATPIKVQAQKIKVVTEPAPPPRPQAVSTPLPRRSYQVPIQIQSD